MSVDYVIDDFQDAMRASNGARWELISDRVMGGVSDGTARFAEVLGRQALHVQGTVSLENNGGFLQIAIELDRDTGIFDASDYRGIALQFRGDGERYGLHLRSADTRRPWQSYRAQFTSSREWMSYRLPFGSFVAHRTERPLAVERLRRLGIIAIGTARPVDFAVSQVSFYR
ncbi:MAG: CIA30 family protein [Congregibacter sp.]